MGEEEQEIERVKRKLNNKVLLAFFFRNEESWEKVQGYFGLSKKELDDIRYSEKFLEDYMEMRQLSLIELDMVQRKLAREGSERSLEFQMASQRPQDFDSKTRSALIQAESARNTAETLANALQASDIIEIIANDVGNSPELSDKKAYLAIDSENSELAEILDDSSQDLDPVRREGEGGSE